jgi:hypothetical protein
MKEEKKLNSRETEIQKSKTLTVEFLSFGFPGAFFFWLSVF